MGGGAAASTAPPPPKPTSIAHFVPPTFPHFLFLPLVLVLLPPPTIAINITALLSPYPDLSDFSSLISSTAVISDISSRNSLTLLAVPNSHLHSSSDAASLADVIRYHILLRYLTWSDLRQIPSSGTLVPTLLQATGRAPDNLGSLNLTFNPSNGVVSLQNPNSNSSSSSAIVLSLVKSITDDLSIFAVSALISPYESDRVAPQTRPPSPSINITKALIDGHTFNVAVSMLTGSGVVNEFEADEAGAGITLFIPTDEAFTDLPPSVHLPSLPADKKDLVLKFHVLHSYYPLGSLESIVNPVQPTLATEDNGAGTFTLNISKVNGSVALNSGLVVAVVTQTVFDQNPVAIFGISNVLLPREIFGGLKETSMSGGGAVAEPPDSRTAVEISPLSHLSSPPGFGEDESSEAGAGAKQGIFGLFSTAVLLYVIGVCNF